MKSSLKVFSLSLMAINLSLLTACGGGGGGSGSSAEAKQNSAKLTSHVFAADNGVDGVELFISNGTSSGTKLLKNINAAGGSDLSSFIKMGANTYFVANDGIHGKELWKTDGSSAGTVMVKDIEPGGYSSDPREFTVFNNKLFFVAYEASTRNEMWVSDGSEQGTELFKEFKVGAAFDGEISNLTIVNGTLFFAAAGANNTGIELWKSDGSAAGTVMVKNIYPGSVNSSPQNLTAVGNTLYFTAHDGRGRNLWKSDGSAAGTVRVKDMDFYNPKFDQLTEVSGALFFVAEDGISGRELWYSDGTEQGTIMVKDINNGGIAPMSVVMSARPPSSNPKNLTVFDGNVFFAANDGVHGVELWKSDGSAAGTIMVKDIQSPGNAYPESLIVIDNKLLFTASEAGGNHSIWQSDGTEAGTQPLIDLTSSGNDNKLASLGEQYVSPPLLMTDENTVLITGDSGNDGVQLFRTNGSAAGTQLVKRINLSGDAF